MPMYEIADGHRIYLDGKTLDSTSEPIELSEHQAKSLLRRGSVTRKRGAQRTDSKGETEAQKAEREAREAQEKADAELAAREAAEVEAREQAEREATAAQNQGQGQQGQDVQGQGQQGAQRAQRTRQQS